jgi:hypothetical protein
LNLAGGVTAEREREILSMDASAVIAHPHQGDAAGLYVDIDPGRARVQAVLE